MKEGLSGLKQKPISNYYSYLEPDQNNYDEKQIDRRKMSEF